jgi:hypothetical protein
VKDEESQEKSPSRSRFVDYDPDKDVSDDADEDELDEAPRSRKQTNSAVVPFVAQNKTVHFLTSR